MRKKLVLSLPKELVERGKNFVPKALATSQDHSFQLNTYKENT
jgi:hypothetical protein